MRLETGDLVRFDLHEEDDLRLALDPCVISASEYPGIAEELLAAGAGLARNRGSLPVTPAEQEANLAARVVEFPAPSRAHPPGAARISALRPVSEAERPALPRAPRREMIFRIVG
ncbi:MAG: hypothetical protein RIG84_07395 [Roseovarius sp.]